MPNSSNAQPVYELDTAVLETVSKCRDQIHEICGQHMHKPVRVQTIHGQYHDGIIVHIDSYHLYLQMLPGHSRAFLPGPFPPFNPYFNNVILPLALFDLLAIALLV